MKDKSKGNALEISLKEGSTKLNLNGVEINDVLGYKLLGSAEKGFTELNLSVVISEIKIAPEVQVQEQVINGKISLTNSQFEGLKKSLLSGQQIQQTHLL